MTTPKPECIDALVEAADRLGTSPTKAAYEDLGLQPSSATITRQMGGWNAAKEAAGLETNCSRGSRVEEKPEDVTLPDGKTWSELSVDQRWHYRNSEWNTERTVARRRRLRAWVNERKRERGCQRCGVTDPAVLDFHHRDPVEKEQAVGEMVTYGHGRASLKAEMEKCDVVCANCHRRLHHTAPESDARQWVYDYKREAEGCVNCGFNDPASLEFHHVEGQKRASVARMLANGRPLERIEAEVAKCDLLCANCHRREHYEPPQTATSYDNHK